MAELEKEIRKEERKAISFVKKNSWMVVSAVLLVILVVVAVWPRGIGANAAGEKLVSFLNSNVVQDGGVSLENVSAAGSLYLVNVNYKGQIIPVYTTKSGDYFIQSATEMTPITGSASASSASASAEVPKADKPVVRAFIFSYCPYGLQFEKALIPVYDLLKNKADINIVAIGAMHGEFEKVESLRQLCIEKNYGRDKLFAYLDKFNTNTAIGNCNGDATCLSPLLSPLMSGLGIDKAKIDSCMTTDAEALYAADGQAASALGISGSPTFVINGVESSVSRTPESIKQAICDAFTTAPAECSQTLSSASASPGFGSDAGNSASSSASC